MSVYWKQYSLAELKAAAMHSFREGGGSRPDVSLIEINGEHAVLKDYSGADYWFSLILGPLLTWRECKALHWLADFDNTPTLLYKPSSRSFLMSYHVSEPVTRTKEITANWPEFFQLLQHAIAQMHAHGIAHNDLRNPTNILISPDGKPILVDLVGCFCRGSNWNFISKWIFNKFCLVDLSAITKLKQGVAPELIVSNDVHAGNIAGNFGMRVRSFGQWVRTISRQLFTDNTDNTDK